MDTWADELEGVGELRLFFIIIFIAPCNMQMGSTRHRYFTPKIEMSRQMWRVGDGGWAGIEGGFVCVVKRRRSALADMG